MLPYSRVGLTMYLYGIRLIEEGATPNLFFKNANFFRAALKRKVEMKI